MSFFLSFPRGFFRLGWRFPSFAGHRWCWGGGDWEVKVAACGVPYDSKGSLYRGGTE